MAEKLSPLTGQVIDRMDKDGSLYVSETAGSPFSIDRDIHHVGSFKPYIGVLIGACQLSLCGRMALRTYLTLSIAVALKVLIPLSQIFVNLRTPFQQSLITKNYKKQNRIGREIFIRVAK